MYVKISQKKPSLEEIREEVGRAAAQQKKICLCFKGGGMCRGVVVLTDKTWSDEVRIRIDDINKRERVLGPFPLEEVIRVMWPV